MKFLAPGDFVAEMKTEIEMMASPQTTKEKIGTSFENFDEIRQIGKKGLICVEDFGRILQLK